MAYTQKKVADHQWVIEYTDGGDPITDVYLLDHQLETLQALSFDDDEIDVGLDDYGDGVYVIKVIKTSTTIEYVSVVDFSDAYACYKALFKYIICSCDDPCNECDEDLRAREYDMNSIMALVEVLKEMIYLERSQYYGIYSMDNRRSEMYDEMGVMIDKLRIITERCGLCDEGSSNVIDC